MRALFVCSAFVLLAFVPVAAAEKLSSLDDLIDGLFKPAEIESVSLSPDGATISYQLTYNGGLALATVDASTLKRLGYIAGEAGEGLVDPRWVDDRWIVYYIAKWNKYYVDGIMANRTLTDRRRVRKRGFGIVVDSTPYVKNDVIMIQPDGDPLHHHLLRVDVTQPFDAVQVAARNPGDVVGWGVDLAGVVRTGYKRRPDGKTDFLHRWKEGDPWETHALPPDTYVTAFNPQGNVALLTYPKDGDRTVLQGYDFAAQRLVGNPIEDPVYDLAPATLRDSTTREVVGLYYNADRPRFLWFDETYAAINAHLRKTMPNHVHWFHGITTNRELLVQSWSDVDPSQYWLLDLSTFQGRVLRKSRPWLDSNQMRPMDPVQFAARDGYTVRGYLTKPADGPGPYPLLLVIHGGPYARDVWGFNAECQFFAALGYAVLQVNYRGSTGFGEAHQLPTILDVMRQSVDDVTDAARWAIDTGLADPSRVGIYGASYGGYIALAAAARYPDQFRCALGFAGVYDWELQFRDNVRNNRGLFDWQKERWGDAKEHPDKFRPYSPIFQASAIKAPVWLAHGGADWVVYGEQTKRMAAALRKEGKVVELKLDSWGVHGFPDTKKRREHYRALAGFLDRHLPR